MQLHRTYSKKLGAAYSSSSIHKALDVSEVLSVVDSCAESLICLLRAEGVISTRLGRILLASSKRAFKERRSGHTPRLLTGRSNVETKKTAHNRCMMVMRCRG